jgi:Peptidase family M48
VPRILLTAALLQFFVFGPAAFSQQTAPDAKSEPSDTVRASQTKPPPCTHQHSTSARNRQAARRTPTRTFAPIPATPPGMPAPMAEMFRRMSQQMAIDPARGFQGFVGEMSRLEGPALENVRLSRDEERTIGRRARDEYLQAAKSSGYDEVNDPEKLEYLKALVANLRRRMKNGARYPDIEIRLIDAPIPDGHAFPGGYLVFTTGLLGEPDEATVAGVVAHELAHLDLGHVYQYAKRAKLAESTFSNNTESTASFEMFFTRGMAMMGLMMCPYRPEHESEADCSAVTWLYQEGYDPEALVRYFERLHEREVTPRMRAQVPVFALGQSHPMSLDRRREALERLGQLKRWKMRDDLGLYPDNLRVLRPKAPSEIP